MVYQVTVVGKSGDGDGENHYCTIPTIRDRMALVMHDRHPGANIRVRSIESPTQDQLYQAAQNDSGWGTRDADGKLIG